VYRVVVVAQHDPDPERGERCTNRGIAVLVRRATPMPMSISPTTSTIGPSAVILSLVPIWNALREMLMKPCEDAKVISKIIGFPLPLVP